MDKWFWSPRYVGLALSAMLFTQGIVHGQGFNRRYDAFGTNDPQSCFGVELLGDGYVLFSTDERSETPNDPFRRTVLLTHIDASGEVVWENSTYLGGVLNEQFRGDWSVAIPEDGFIVGATVSYSETSKGVLIRYNNEGDTLWTRSYSGASYMFGYHVTRMNDGGFVLVGATVYGPGGFGIAIRTDENGDELWSRIYSPEDTFQDDLFFWSVASGPNGDLYMLGRDYASQYTGHPVLLRTDGSGEELWRLNDWTTGTPRYTALAMTLDGHPVGCGWRSLGTNHEYPYIAKFDSADGSTIWTREFQVSSSIGELHAIKECANGDLVAAGSHSTRFDLPGYEGLLLRVTSDGDSIWRRTFGCYECPPNSSNTAFRDVLPTMDGGFIAVGTVWYVPYSPTNSWVVKVDSLGCILPGCIDVGVSEQMTDLLDAISFSPNPAAEHTTVRLELPPAFRNELVDLAVVAPDGRIVHSDAVFGTGTYDLPLHGLPAGMYHVHVTVGTTWLTGAKLVVQ